MAPGARYVVVSGLLSVAIGGCGAHHYLHRGADLYAAQRYVEADEVFERSRTRVARAGLAERATYATFRGATFLALGDAGHAAHWLGMAAAIERSRPGTLRERDRQLLVVSVRALHPRDEGAFPLFDHAPEQESTTGTLGPQAGEIPLGPPEPDRARDR